MLLKKFDGIAVIDLQFLNTDSKFTTCVLLSNNPLGIDVKVKHALNVPEKDVTFVLLSNNPLGIDEIPVQNTNVLTKEVTFDEKSNKPFGIIVIPVCLNVELNLSTVFNPSFKVALLETSDGIVVKLIHPKKSICSKSIPPQSST